MAEIFYNNCSEMEVLTFEEIRDLHAIIERRPNWNAIERVSSRSTVPPSARKATHGVKGAFGRRVVHVRSRALRGVSSRWRAIDLASWWVMARQQRDVRGRRVTASPRSDRG